MSRNVKSPEKKEAEIWSFAVRPIRGCIQPMEDANDEYENKEIATIILPILSSTSNYFCCCRRFHITVAAKIVSLASSVVYFGLVFIVTLGGNSAAVLNAIIIALSVSACAIYGAFRWCKLCLIPFMMFQGILMLYAIASLIAVVYSIFQRSSYLHSILNELIRSRQLKISPQIGLLALVYVLLLLIVLIIYSLRIIWHEYQFIAQIDNFVRRTQKDAPEV